MPNFYPRPPRGGRLAVLAFSALLAAISIHALREEGDRRGYRDRPDPVDFYPRPPRGGRQRLRLVAAQRHRFLSTPSARRATKLRGYGRSRRDISIHALREEGDLRFRRKTAAPIPFLSTPSARRATFPCLIVMSRPSNFYPRPPRGGRPGTAIIPADKTDISIHALREEGDVRAQTCCRVAIHFYPRPPRGGRRRGTASLPGHGKISIHALREEGDELRHGCRRGCPISIHALREEGDLSRMAQNLQQVKFLSTPSARRATSQASNKSHRPKPFLSTPSARRATFFRCTSCWIDTISIHALREEGDRKRHRAVGTDTNFYPRPPRGGRLSTGSCFCLTL